MARTTRPTSDNYSFGVQHTALKAADGTPSGWFGIQRTDNNKVIGVSSEKYGIVKNADVINAVKEAIESHGQSLGEYDEEINCVRDGSRMYGGFTFKNFTREVPRENREKGDVVGMRLTVNNSYDRSCRVSLSVGMLRLVCTNGMTSLTQEQGMTKKHSLQVDISFIRDAISGCIEKFESSVAHLGKLSQVSLTQDQGTNILKNLSEKKVISEVVRAGIANIWNAPSYQEDEARNLYSLYNASTQYLTHEVSRNRLEYSSKVDKALLGKFSEMRLDSGKFSLFSAKPKEKKQDEIVTSA